MITRIEYKLYISPTESTKYTEKAKRNKCVYMQLLNVTDVVVSRGAILTNPTRKQQVNDLRSSVMFDVFPI